MDTQLICYMVVRRQVILVTLNPNVVIGFVFRCSDRLGERVCGIVEDAEVNHSGHVVRTECFGGAGTPGRADRIMEEISDELLRAGREVLRGCMENWSEVEVLLDAHDAGLGVAEVREF